MRITQQPETLKNAPVSTLAKVAILFATAFGCGYAKKAPGTIGSLPGLAIGATIAHLVPGLLFRGGLLVVLTLLAVWAIHLTEKTWDTHDDQRIVIDEVAGQALAIAFLPLSMLSVIFAFALFRLFDIWKPGPIGWADASLPGVWGTLTDDLIAGAAAGVCAWGLVTYVF